MVGDTGIEPVTPSMSTKCSTAELITHYLYLSALAHTDPNEHDAENPAPNDVSIRGVAQVIKGFGNTYFQPIV